MKRYRPTLLFFILVLASLAQTGCREHSRAPDISKVEIVTESQQVPQEAQTTEGMPRITFEETVYDFGEVSSNRKYAGQFKFTNTGSGVLKITEVKKCCGAVVTLDKEELAPGENGTLKVEYNTGRSSGPMSRQLSVYSNDKTKPKVALTIKAQVMIRIDYQPQRIELLLNTENAGCPKITITSLDKQPFSITSFQSTGDTLTADIDPSVEATKFVLTPKVDPEKRQKQPSGLVSINLTHPELESLKIPFITKKRFKLTPSGVFLLNPLPEKPSINKVSIVSNYDEDFEIDSVSSEKGTAKVVSQKAIANGYQLYVEITPPQPDETQSFEDVVNVNLKGGETLAIKCYVRYLSK